MATVWIVKLDMGNNEMMIEEVFSLKSLAFSYILKKAGKGNDIIFDEKIGIIMERRKDRRQEDTLYASEYEVREELSD
jgi:hypothetical protein